MTEELANTIRGVVAKNVEIRSEIQAMIDAGNAHEFKVTRKQLLDVELQLTALESLMRSLYEHYTAEPVTEVEPAGRPNLRLVRGGENDATGAKDAT